MRAALLLLGLPAFAVGTSTPSPDVGGITNVSVTDELTQVLTAALTDGYFDDAVGDLRICYTEIDAVQTQVDAGEFFYFQGLGCQVTTSEGACSVETQQSCSIGQFEVIVFKEESTTTPEVISIKLATEPVDPVTADPVTDDPITGGWYTIGVDTQLLTNALTSSNYASSVGNTRVCFSEVTAAEAQVVDGMNYRFNITGCDVTGSDSEGACSNDVLSTCTLADYVIEFYESFDDGGLQVTGITEVSTSIPGTPPPTYAPGDWYPVDVTDENTQVLANALSGGNYSDSVGSTRVCYYDVTAVEQQLVAGFNYHFYIDGCVVTDSEGACSSDTLAACTLEVIVVDVFEQSWTNTLEVTGITIEGSSSKTAEPITATPSTTAPIQIVGGWTVGEVTEENTKLLSEALVDGNYSDSVGVIRVCYAEVTEVETQVVAGTNYRFHITGCDVTGSDSEGACSADTLKTCTLEDYVVQVFEQTWTNTLEVTSITQVGSGSTTSAPVTTTPSTTAPVAGGWTVVEVTEENTKLLFEALVDGNYSDSVDIRVCYAEVTEVETQVVAGINYRFHITGCDVTGSDSEGECSSDTLKTCTLEEFVVQIFSQSWTNTLEVTSITLVGSGSKTSEPVTATPSTTAPVTATPATTAPVTSSPVTSSPVTGSPVTSSPVTGSPATSSPKTGSPTTTSPNGNSSGSNDERQAHQAC